MAPDTMTLLLDYTGLKLYMTREALQQLAAKLIRISEAPPEECYEVHVRSAFSEFDANDNLAEPPLKASGELRAILDKLHKEAVDQAIQEGEAPEGSQPVPFELTFMHISPEAVREAAAWSDDEL